MKVLHLVNSLDKGSGITNVVVDLSVTQAKHDDEVLVASLRQYYAEFLAERGVQFCEINFADRRPLPLLRTLGRLRRIVAEFRPDIIHVHTITPLLLCRAVFTRTPIIATVHNEFQKSSDLMRYATIAVGVSSSVTESMVRRGIPRESMRTVPNGTTGSPRRPRQVKKADLQHPAVLYVGSLRERKGTDVLLDSFSIVHQSAPEAHLYLVGNNDLPVTETILEALGIRSVTHLVGLSDPYPFYAGADLFILPSRSEPAALVLLEAMESGMPIIGSGVGGIKDFLEDEGGGLTVPAGDSEALAETILCVLQDPSLRKELEKRAKNTAVNHSVEKLYDQYSAIYREVCSTT